MTNASAPMWLRDRRRPRLPRRQRRDERDAHGAQPRIELERRRMRRHHRGAAVDERVRLEGIGGEARLVAERVEHRRSLVALLLVGIDQQHRSRHHGRVRLALHLLVGSFFVVGPAARLYYAAELAVRGVVTRTLSPGGHLRGVGDHGAVGGAGERVAALEHRQRRHRLQLADGDAEAAPPLVERLRMASASRLSWPSSAARRDRRAAADALAAAARARPATRDRDAGARAGAARPGGGRRSSSARRCRARPARVACAARSSSASMRSRASADACAARRAEGAWCTPRAGAPARRSWAPPARPRPTASARARRRRSRRW